MAQEVVGLIRRPAVDHLVDHRNHVVLGDFRDRPVTPSIDEFAPQLALDDRGLARLRRVPLDELLGDSPKIVLLTAKLGQLFAILIDLGVDSLAKQRAPSPRLLPGLLECQFAIGAERSPRRVRLAGKSGDQDE